MGCCEKNKLQSPVTGVGTLRFRVGSFTGEVLGMAKWFGIHPQKIFVLGRTVDTTD